jgi:hypothetical protein
MNSRLTWTSKNRSFCRLQRMKWIVNRSRPGCAPELSGKRRSTLSSLVALVSLAGFGESAFDERPSTLSARWRIVLLGSSPPSNAHSTFFHSYINLCQIARCPSTDDREHSLQCAGVHVSGDKACLTATTIHSTISDVPNQRMPVSQEPQNARLAQQRGPTVCRYQVRIGTHNPEADGSPTVVGTGESIPRYLEAPFRAPLLLSMMGSKPISMGAQVRWSAPVGFDLCRCLPYNRPKMAIVHASVNHRSDGLKERTEQARRDVADSIRRVDSHRCVFAHSLPPSVIF